MLDIARDHRHLLLNRADDNVGLGADRVESILGMPVAPMVETSMDIAAATNAGQPIMIAATRTTRSARRCARVLPPASPASRSLRPRPRCTSPRTTTRPDEVRAVSSGEGGDHEQSR